MPGRILPLKPSAGLSLAAERIAEEFQALVESYVARRYQRKEGTP